MKLDNGIKQWMLNADDELAIPDAVTGSDLVNVFPRILRFPLNYRRREGRAGLIDWTQQRCLA